MNTRANRPCPLRDGCSGQRGFPYAVRFAGQVFNYLRCDTCRSVFVDPVPDDAVFAQMYEKAAYHDVHYGDSAANSLAYVQSVDLLSNHAPEPCRVLDYGCGAVKRGIAELSRAIGRMRFGAATFGNRFEAVIRHRAGPADSSLKLVATP